MKGEKTVLKENIPASSVQRTEADSVKYFVLCLKRYVRLH
jgi:hypothetical protein